MYCTDNTGMALTPPSLSNFTMNTDETPTLSSRIDKTIAMVTSILVSAAFTILIAFGICLYIIWWSHARQKQDSDHQGAHSLRHRETAQLELTANTNLYEQIHLSSSTKFIPSAGISSISSQPQADFHGIYPCIDTGQPKSTSQELEEDDPIYAVVGKGNHIEQHKDSHDGPPVLPNNHNIAASDDKSSATDDSKPKLGEDTLKEMYAVVNKKLKVEKEENAPLAYPHMVDKSYIPADQKNPYSSMVTTVNDRAEELYTFVKKKSKGNEYEEVAPPIPPHTVEELYTAVQKKPKGTITVDNEEEAPPCNTSLNTQ